MKIKIIFGSPTTDRLKQTKLKSCKASIKKTYTFSFRQNKFYR